MHRSLRLVPFLLVPFLLGAQEHAADAATAAHGIRAEHFFLVLIAILVVGKGLGEIAERLGQPSVLGELIAGVILGASVLAVVPVDGPMAEMITLLAEIGVAILLFEIGLETDLREMFRVGPSASLVALVGVAVPFLLGFLYWYWTTPAIGTHPGGVTDTLVAIFVGATLTATSVGITARVLTDLGRIHTAEARVIIGAAVVDDVLGLVILAVVSGLAAGAGLTALGIARTFAIAVGFLVAAVIIGNMVAPWLFRIIDNLQVRGILLVSAFSFALLFGALAGLAGSALIIGSFAAGIVLSSTNQFDLIEERIKPVADVFTPVFFVSVGAAVNVALFLPWSDQFNWGVLQVGGALLVIAIIGKLVSGFTVGWGRKKLNHMAIGVGMVPRGEVGLIFAQIGLVNGILSSEVFSAILIMVIFTTFIAPPLLKVIFSRGQDHVGTGGLPVHPGAAEVETASARWS
ncbi:MAG TPA: cation:proton antiporter [Longimicrobiales bacterium]|nr:cation:proton antiporter [Longimicrobiales bacterium]